MSLTRRTLLKTAAVSAGGAALASVAGRSFATATPGMPLRVRGGQLTKLHLLHIGIGGSIAPGDRGQLKGHKDVVFSGLCDIDANTLAGVSKQHPEVFTCQTVVGAFG